MTLLPPTVEQQRRIDEELPPDPEMRKRDIQMIRDWLAKQPHLPKHMGKFAVFFRIKLKIPSLKSKIRI